MISVEIDPGSGFCGGVIRAISTAEKYLEGHPVLYSLGSIVHNEEELARLGAEGLRSVGAPSEVPAGSAVLIRAHGVPPEVYSQAREAGLEVIDCTCPMVLNLQKSIREASGRVLIFGKHGHPEVLGLMGQTDSPVVFQDTDELLEALDAIPRDAAVDVFSQTTMSPEGYRKACGIVRERIPGAVIHNSICSQVASRHRKLSDFAASHDVVVFVSGRSSSNGKVLCELCRSVNPRTYQVRGADELRPEWFRDGDSVGVSGATSTPKWLLEKVAAGIKNLQ